MSGQLLAEGLQRSQRFCAVCVATRQEVLERLKAAAFDVLLISTNLAEDSSHRLNFVREVRNFRPSVRVVVLLDAMVRATVVEAFRSGALGVFCRSDSFQALCKCVACVHQGQVWASSAELQFLLEALVEPVPLPTRDLPGSRPLSKREEEIAQLVAEGFSNRQISERLDLSEHTIKNYLFRVFEKLGVSTRVELTLFALKRGRVPDSRPQGLGAGVRPRLGYLENENRG